MGDERAVYADKAYEKHARRAALKARGAKDRIQHRRTRSQKQLPHWQSVRNKLIGRIRGAIERTFSVLKRRYGLVRMRYRGPRRTHSTSISPPSPSTSEPSQQRADERLNQRQPDLGPQKKLRASAAQASKSRPDPRFAEVSLARKELSA
jgi:Transposase DDE domain